jgi:hypothetical protein
LELVTYDENLCDNGHQDGGEEPWKLDKKIVVDADGKPQEDDHARCSFIDDVPDDKGEAHGKNCAPDSAKEAEDGLSRSCDTRLGDYGCSKT